MSTSQKIVKLNNFAERLRDLSVDMIAEAKFDETAPWEKDPKAVALALLNRTLASFKGAIIMVQEGLVVEARTLTRSCCENLIFIARLKEEGPEFINLLVQDERASRRSRGKSLLARSNALGMESNWEKRIDAHLKKYPKVKALRLGDVPKTVPLADAYVYYSQLSGDSAHATISSLGLHLPDDQEEAEKFLKYTVSPEAGPERVFDTLRLACEMLLGVCIWANEIFGAASASDKLHSLLLEFIEIGKPSSASQS
jgi:hypothetical protein